MEKWINNRPENWENKKVMRSWGKLTLEGEYEAGADAMYKAITRERPCEEEWRLKILAIEFGELSVPDFLQWLKGKLLIKKDG